MSTQVSFTRGNALQTIVFDSATRNMQFTADLTDSPQEAAGLATDGWVNKPDALSLNAMLTDYPISIAGRGVGGTAEAGRAKRLLNELIAVKSAGLVCSVGGIGIGQFDSVRISAINITQDKPLAGAIEFSISFRQSVVADSRTVPLVTKAERKPQAVDDKGKKGTEDADPNKKKESYLHKAKTGIVNGLNQLLPESWTK